MNMYSTYVCTAQLWTLVWEQLGNQQQLNAFFMRKRMWHRCPVLKLMAGAVHIRKHIKHSNCILFLNMNIIQQCVCTKCTLCMHAYVHTTYQMHLVGLVGTKINKYFINLFMHVLYVVYFMYILYCSSTVTRFKISICSVHMGLHAFLMVPTTGALRGVRGPRSPHSTSLTAVRDCLVLMVWLTWHTCVCIRNWI
jgi:hypothetical protein